jgi:haloacetate dehalogenase
MSKMFPGFETFDVQISNGINIHGVRSPTTGPPLLLLHGFPQTHHIWHLIAPQLTPLFTVIALDLPGYGASSKIPSSALESHKPYSKSVLASNCVEAVDALGFKDRRFGVVGHDRGGRVAHKMCVDFPERVERCMVLDIAPTLAMFEQTSQGFATDYWHWFFLIQPAPFPETLILSNPSVFQARFFGSTASATLSAPFIHEEAMQFYSKQFNDADGVHAMCEDYRAAATIDLVEAKEDLESGRKVKCELRVLWGSKGVVEKRFDALREWRAVCEGVVSGEAVESGHYVPEEVPEVVTRHVKEFWGV